MVRVNLPSINDSFDTKATNVMVHGKPGDDHGPSSDAFDTQEGIREK